MTLDMPNTYRLPDQPISESVLPSDGVCRLPMSARVIPALIRNGPTAEPALAISPWDAGPSRHGEARAPEHYVLRFISTETVPLLRSLNYAKLDWHQFTFERPLKRGGTVTRSWFPSYLFLHVDIRRDFWQQVYDMPGVISVLGQPRPKAVGATTMAYLHETLSKPLEPATVATKIPPGTVIKVRSGPCAGFEGVVQKSYRRSVDFMVVMFSRPVMMNMKIEEVEVIEE